VQAFGQPGPVAAVVARLGPKARAAGTLAWHPRARSGEGPGAGQLVARIPLSALRAGDLLVPSLLLPPRVAAGAAGWSASLCWTGAHGARRAHLAAIGLARMAQPAGAPAMSRAPVDGVRAAVDCFELERSLDAAELEVRVHDAGDPQAVTAGAVVVVSVRPLKLSPPSPRSEPLTAPPTTPVDLPVPAASQMREAPGIARAICSPTSLAMVLAYWRGDEAPDVAGLAADARCPESGLYGVWPANLAAAARRGMDGAIRCFDDLEEAVALLRGGTPLVVSVRFDTGELPGAALERTSGHLMVLRGVRGGEAWVNDPAAADPAEVPRPLPLDAFARAWLARRGVAYVLWPGALADAAQLVG